ncbi:MAG: hypothetical protein RSA91_00360 [Bacilli bacterium]
MNVLFLGADGTGKSHTLLNVAKVLEEENKRVLVVDLSWNQGINSYFDFEIENEVEKELDVKVRDNIDIYNFKNEINISELLKLDMKVYDYVLVESDFNLDERVLSFADKILLLQNFDKDKLIKNVSLVNRLGEHTSKLSIILNQALDNRIDTSYFLDDLIQAAPNRATFINSKQFEIPLDERDIKVALENKVDGRLNLKNYSKDFKLAIKEIALNIKEESEK